MGHIFGHLTGTRVRWETDENGDTHEDPIEEHGWVDRSWSPYVLHDGRNDVRPVVDVDESDTEQLAEEVLDALGWLEGGYEDNGGGTFYSSGSYMPFHDNPEGWSYSYALHFTRKSYESRGYVERPWHPVEDGGIGL